MAGSAQRSRLAAADRQPSDQFRSDSPDRPGAVPSRLLPRSGRPAVAGVTASLRQQQRDFNDQIRPLQRAEAQLQAFRRALEESTSAKELDQRFTALQGPRLDDADRSLLMPVLRSRVAALLDGLADQLDQQRRRLPSSDPVVRLPEILRSAFSSLTLAGGFAALARRPGIEVSLLGELRMAWHNAWQRLRLRLGLPVSGRGAGRGPAGDADYLRQISAGQNDRAER